MDLGIQGKKALITGGTRGLGRSIAACLAEEGVTVALVGRTQTDLNSFLAQFGSHHIALHYDLMESGAPQQMLAQLLPQFGYPDIVIHNLGGTLDINHPFCSLSDWQKVYRFNLEIAVELNLELIPHLQRQKWGRVVHISSIAALENQGTVPYCSVKAALNAYTRSMGRYVSPDGVCITAVMPGAVLTEKGYWDVASQERPEHVKKYLKERMAIQRFGTPDEIGKVVTFLCSQHASFMVGSSVLVDGGQGRAFSYE